MTDFDVDEMVIWTSPRTHEQISMSFRGKTGLTFCALYNMKTGMQVIAPLSEVDHDWHQMCETEETKHAQTRTELAYTLQERNEYLLRAESAEARLRELEAENAKLKMQVEQEKNALKPFSKLAAGLKSKWGASFDDAPDEQETVFGDDDYIITVGHLRKAIEAQS